MQRFDAQRRPGPAPRRHSFAAPASFRFSNAQRRPGPAPRRHVEGGFLDGVGATALNEGRDPRPGDTCAPPPGRGARGSLNEGRDPRPGDTRLPLGLDLARPRSTKAGTRTPATRTDRGPRVTSPRRRSTKAGTRAPATPLAPMVKPLPVGTAQRRPGPAPRRHVRVAYEGRTDVTAQRRPGPAPRRHTAMRPSAGAGWAGDAQRRPGPAPRRHAAAPRQLGTGQRRSTKAGTRAPATLKAKEAAPPEDYRSAQRRPGPAPRRHWRSGAQRLLAVSTAQRRPGPAPRRHIRAAVRRSPAICAQRRPGPAPRRHTVARDRTPGLNLTAQRRPGPAPRRHLALERDRLPRGPLNEGRDPRPGDTVTRVCFCTSLSRSTKAGTRAPATPDVLLGRLDPNDRSTKAGTRAPATPGSRDSSTPS